MVGRSGPSSRDDLDTRKVIEAARAKLDAVRAKRVKSPLECAPQQTRQAPDGHEVDTQVSALNAQIQGFEGG